MKRYLIFIDSTKLEYDIKRNLPANLRELEKKIGIKKNKIRNKLVNMKDMNLVYFDSTNKYGD